jgi:lipopolysaccharide transport system ATP-binding protein
MGDFAVHAEGLSKRYTLGQLETGLGWLRRRAARRTHEPAVTWALSDVSFEIPEGQAVAVIGRNGAGKSTLLKILSRITEPTAGFVDVAGRVGSLLEVGTGFHPELTGRENIYLNGAILGMRRAEVARKFDDIVEFAGVERFIDTPVKRYSSGMYVRLAFAVAAHLEPEILVVDEVLAVGDAEFQKRCLGRMSEVASAGRTVLFVSHNMQAVRRLCERSLLLERGSLVADDETEVVVRRYLASVDANEGGQRRWDDAESRPGDAVCRLVGARIADEAGNTASTFLSSQPIVVTIEFDLAETQPALSAGFDLASVDGSLVFRTFHTDAPEESRPTLVAGRNVVRCTIPPGLLNTGRYAIHTRILLHMIRWLVHEDAVLTFDVVADHGESLFLNAEARPGVVAPMLAWAGETIGDGDLRRPLVASG